MRIRSVALAVALFSTAALTQAAETPIGKHKIVSNMEIGAVYLQPIKMEPAGMMLDADKADIHLEADIHSTKGNKNGFAEGDWIPNLVIKYEIEKASGEKISGDMMPMVASDGPHYGDNVKLAGPGKYKLKLTVYPQSKNEHAMFGRHTDKETGVGPWFKEFDLNYDFVFAGIGKKGGY
jgi:periplasmic iron binding protein